MPTSKDVAKAPGKLRKADEPIPVAQTTLIMPMVEDTIIGLGDLWDCKACVSPGNIFGKAFEKEHLEAFPMQTLEYYLYQTKDTKDRITALNISASLALEMSFSAVEIKLSGSAKFDQEDTKKFTQEQLTCRYDSSTYVVRVRPSTVENIIDKTMKAKLYDGTVKATHYVQSVRLGGHVEGTIRYSNKIDRTHMNMEGSFSGEIKTTAVTIKAEASLKMLDTEYSEEYETEVFVNACPRFDKAPTSVSEMFDGVSKIDEKVKGEKHFPLFPQVEGVPLSFKLVPLTSLFHDFEPDGLFKVLQDDVMDKFTDMIFTCQDFLQPHYIKGLLREKEYRLVTILTDENNPFTLKVSELERECDRKAREIKVMAFEVYARFKEAEADAKDILDVVDYYDKHFNIVELMAHIHQELGQEGRKELTGIHAGDVVNLKDEDSKPTVRFFSNKVDRDDWWSPERTIKILLRTSTATESPSGTFLRLFNLSGELSKIDVQVGICFPNISDNDFSLTLKIRDKMVTYRGEDIPFALDVLAIAIEQGDNILRLYYRLTSTLSGIHLQNIPDNLSDITSLISIFKASRDVIICETYPQLVARLIESSEDTWNFVLPVQALNTSFEMTKFFRQLRDYLPEEFPRLPHRWIIPRFNNILYDAPLLLVFKESQLKIICLDHLDILIMIHQFRKSQKSADMTLLSHEALKSHCLYPARANFVIKLLEGLVLDHSTTLSDLVPPIPNFDTPCNDELDKAIQVVRPAAARNELDVINTVATLGIADLPDLRFKLEKRGWTDDGFLSVSSQGGTDWNSLHTDLKRFLGDQAPYLVKVEGAIKSLLALRPPTEPGIPETPEPDPDPEPEPGQVKIANSYEIESNRTQKVVRFGQDIREDEEEDDRKERVIQIIKFVTDWGTTPAERSVPNAYLLKGTPVDEEIIFKNLKKEIDGFRPILDSDIEVVIRGILNAMEAFYNEMILGSKEYFNLLQLTLLVEALATEETFKHLLIDLANKYCQRTELVENVYPQYPEAQKKITDSISERNLFKTIGLLASFTQDPLIYSLTEQFYNLTSLTNVDQIKSIIEYMEKFEDPQLREVWLNPKFTFLIRQGIEASEALIETLFVELCVNTDPNVPAIIPRFIPKDIAEKLKPLIYNVHEPQFEWDKDWKDVQAVIQAFQILVTRKFVPSLFPAVLRSNLEAKRTLRSIFKDSGALFYWNETEFYFTKPWSLITISEALQRLMEYSDSKKRPKMSHPIILEMPTSVNAPIPTLNQPVTDKWQRFTFGGHVDKLTSPLLSSIASAIPIPRVQYDDLSSTINDILPFLVQQTNKANPMTIHPSRIAKYIKYPPTDGVPQPGHIDFDAAKPKDISKFLMSRGDLTTVLFNCTEPQVTHNTLLALMKAPIAIPLVVPGIFTTTTPNLKTQPETFKFLLPPLQNLIVTELAGIVPEPHLLTAPFRLIMTLRVGDTTGKLGRSSILNQLLMKHSNTFSSFAEPGAQHGNPIGRPGLVEFTWLSGSTVKSDFYSNTIKPHYDANQPDLVLLGNLHGDALNFPSLLELLKIFTSSFVIFWKANRWSDLKTKKAELAKIIGSGSSVLDLVLYPDATIIEHVGQQNIIGMDSPEEMEKSKAKLHGVFREAIGCKPRMAVPMGSGIGLVEFLRNCKPKAVTTGSVKFHIEDEDSIACRESLELVRFLRIKTIPGVKQAIVTGDAEILETLAALTWNLLNLPIEQRNNALTHFHYELESLSTTSSHFAVERVLALRKDLTILAEQGKFDDQEILELQDEIKGVVIRLQSTQLTIHDIFRVLIKFEDERLPIKYYEYLTSGWSIELFQPTCGEMNMWAEPLTTVFNQIPADTRVFIVSMIGLKASGKSTLLNRLFGQGGFLVGPVGCTNGLHLRFLWVESKLRETLKCDAFLVIDSEGFGAMENFIDANADAHERNMATFVIGISHLTLTNILGDSMKEMSSILESSYTTLTRMSETDVKVRPDLLLVQQQLQLTDGAPASEFHNEWKAWVENVKELTRENEFGVGVRTKSNYRMEMVRQRDKFEELLHTIRPLGSDEELNYLEYHADILDLHTKILEICKNSSHVSRYSDWYSKTNDYWKAIKEVGKNNVGTRDVAATYEALQLRSQEDKVKFAITTAYRTHDKRDIELPFLTSMEEYFEKSVEDEDILRDPESALVDVHKELRAVINTCDRNELNEGNPCNECLSAFSMREALFEETQGQRRRHLTVDAIMDHMNAVRESLWAKYKQHIVAKEIEFGKSKALAKVLKEMKTNYPNRDECWIKFKQHVSTLRTVVPAVDLIHAEARIEYASLQHILPRLSPENPLPDLENMISFDLGYYNRATESYVNSPKRETLTWEQNDWLVAKFEDIPRDLLMDNDVEEYLVGMVRELKNKVEGILKDFENLCEERLLPDFKWEAHLFALKVFQRHMDMKQTAWDKTHDPLVQLENRNNEDFPDKFFEESEED